MRVWSGVRWGAATALFALCVVATPVAAAPDCDNGQHIGNPHCDPSPAMTPELDSLALFGTGIVGVAGYALLRLRSRRGN